eukprot:2846463-Alexandrium_andersonii.AAC.1
MWPPTRPIQERLRLRPHGAVSRRMSVGPPHSTRTPCRTLGRGLAGARAGPTPRTGKAAPRNTASTCARGRTPMQS